MRCIIWTLGFAGCTVASDPGPTSTPQLAEPTCGTQIGEPDDCYRDGHIVVRTLQPSGAPALVTLQIDGPVGSCSGDCPGSCRIEASVGSWSFTAEIDGVTVDATLDLTSADRDCPTCCDPDQLWAEVILQP